MIMSNKALVNKFASYSDIIAAPDDVVAEIIDGDLYTHPRPAKSHSRVQKVLGSELFNPFDKGSGGGPGGWIFFDEVELWLSTDSGPKGNYLVPDISGWKRENLTADELKSPENGFRTRPDWVCEVLSPSTMRHDRVRKMPKYAFFEVPFIWLVDPASRLLEVFSLNENKRWELSGSFANDDKVKAPPFEVWEFDLNSLWL